VKLKEIARMSNKTKEALMTTNDHKTYVKRQDTIIGYINQHPGQTAKKLANELGMVPAKMSSHLYTYVRQGRLKQRKLDGKLRFYAINYLVPAKPAEVKQAEVQPAKPEATTTTTGLAKAIATLAMEYNWCTDYTTLKGFVAWVELKEANSAKGHV
jgi:hypothetical protein